MLFNYYVFDKAMPVWEKNCEKEMNKTICAVAVIKAKKAVLSIAVNSSFIVMVNGEFVASGPARCAHGFYYVDEIDLSKYLTSKENYIAIRSAGYNVNSFCYLDEPSFVCAQITADGNLAAATGEEGFGFSYYNVAERVQKVPRYSFQRPFTESYRLSRGAFEFEFKKSNLKQIKIENTKSKIFIKRIAPYCEYQKAAGEVVFRGKLSYSEKNQYYSDRSIKNISEKLKGFEEEDLEEKLHICAGQIDFADKVACNEKGSEISLVADTYATVKFDKDYCGILSFELECFSDGELYFLFDEMISGNDVVNPFRSNETCNVIKWSFEKGRYNICCAEPYTMKYICAAARGANIKITNLTLNKVEFPFSKITTFFKTEDKDLQEIYDAALVSFLSNVTDIYMDCPSRERAGWLCDSFFMGRVEKLITGKADVEKSFLLNYILPENFANIPDGMIPMCYPADFYDGVYIPNWALWFICQLKEFFDRTSDKEFIKMARNKVYGILNCLKKYENEYGLLEKLDGWVFVEWSDANDFVQDVNFPTNMLYSAAKEATGILYDDSKLKEEAKSLAETICKLSLMENGFFCDNAIRKDGKLQLTGNCTEVCQYYAFFFNIITPESNLWLFNTLINEFGFLRRKKNSFPDISFANTFIGNYLRLDLIKQFCSREILVENIKHYFDYMAKESGTLWEHETSNHSLNHGFTSYVIYWLLS